MEKEQGKLDSELACTYQLLYLYSWRVNAIADFGKLQALMCACPTFVVIHSFTSLFLVICGILRILLLFIRIYFLFSKFIHSIRKAVVGFDGHFVRTSSCFSLFFLWILETCFLWIQKTPTPGIKGFLLHWKPPWILSILFSRTWYKSL
jgi:hypothetical protein